MNSLALHIRNLAAKLEERRDIHNSPYLLGDKQNLSVTEALKVIKTMYKDYQVKTEQVPEGLAYYVSFPIVGRTIVGDYHFDRKELKFRVYPGIKSPR